MTVDDLVDTAEKEVFELAERNMRRETSPIKDIVGQAIREIEINQQREDGLSGIPSGFTGIDKITFGWQKSDLIIIAARPSVGKTAFVLTMARNMAIDHNIPVAFFSLEMPATQLVKRVMIGETGLEADKIRGARKMTSAEWGQLNEGVQESPSLHGLMILFHSSIYEFRSKARRLVNNNKVKIIIIDYLQLMTGPLDFA